MKKSNLVWSCLFVSEWFSNEPQEIDGRGEQKHVVLFGRQVYQIGSIVINIASPSVSQFVSLFVFRYLVDCSLASFETLNKYWGQESKESDTAGI